MISSEVQRTLVKSPPELWTELSDPAALGRHLDEFGEIRITRVEPEKRVEWEAENASGTVLIKPSGWGTRVTLTVSRELPAAEPDEASQAAPETAPELASEPAVPADSTEQEGVWQPPVAAEHHPEPDAEPAQLPENGDRWASDTEPAPEADPEPTLLAEEERWDEEEWEYDSEPEAEEEREPEPRRGFLARLFRRRPRPATVELAPTPAAPHGDGDADADADEPLDPEDQLHRYGTADGGDGTAEWSAEDGSGPVAHAWPQAPFSGVQPVKQPQPATAAAAAQAAAAAAAADASQRRQTADHEPSPDEEQPTEHEQASDISAELKAAEDIAAEEVTAVLTSMLDRLGTAHHRPFSRA
jgi:hypothetical protein